MIMSSILSILQEKDEKNDQKIDEPNMGDNEETVEKNKDKKKNKDGVEEDETSTEDNTDDQLFKDVDNETDTEPVEDDTATDDNIDDTPPTDDVPTDDGGDDIDTDIPTDETETDGDDIESNSDPVYLKIKNINKKKKLISEIIGLYDYYGNVIYRLQALTNLSYEESKIIDVTIDKINDTKRLMYNYIQTMVKTDSYERALSMFMRFKIPISFTEEIIEKIAEKRNNI